MYRVRDNFFGYGGGMGEVGHQSLLFSAYWQLGIRKGEESEGKGRAGKRQMKRKDRQMERVDISTYLLR